MRGARRTEGAARRRGILLFLAALLLFAAADTTTKTLLPTHSAPAVMAMRYAVSLVLLTAIFAPQGGAALVRTRRTGLVVLRALSLVLASLGFASALVTMPVAETSAIVFTSPLLTMLLAGPVAGERIGRWGWVAAAAAFLGVLLIARPGAGLDPAGMAWAGLATVCTMGYALLSRVLAPTERTVPMLWITVLIGAAIYGAALPWTWAGPVVPPAGEAGRFLLLGLVSGIGHLLFTAAYRSAPIAILAPLNYLQLVWAGLLGWAVFRHVPDPLTLLGMAVVAGAGVATALRPARRGAAAGR